MAFLFYFLMFGVNLKFPKHTFYAIISIEQEKYELSDDHE